ncbi:helix-turn-helix domain-containing protein [Hymenobacter arizonensis]|uniref:Helix-turn-helix domain-containing protein n=1 Tax=Hymenobacter arizonensis TaxID=1227077 RepID=A0A1I6AU08_HYMAR|nr:helix-turn-helix domain-containing protein [Hymenobacter arizonensis]SFQ72184.1 Helix-turn-helix domain-containing protein [Hymenobacter arizonensis]
MVLRFQQPALPLRPYVQFYMLVHAHYDGLDPAKAVKPMPPAPQQWLYFYPRDQMRTFHYGQGREISSPRSIVVGPQVSRVDLRFPPNHLMVCAAFWPGGLHRLLGVPVKELFDFSIESRALLGPAVTEVEDRLAETTDYTAMLGVLETYLLGTLRRLRPHPERPLDRLLPALLPTGRTTASLDHLAAEACLSPRQFERGFFERVGMSPKLYARIVRFDRAFRLKEAQPDLDWLAVAVQVGYYDYRHLVRDFKEFAGVTPPQLLAAETSHTRVVGASSSFRPA